MILLVLGVILKRISCHCSITSIYLARVCIVWILDSVIKPYSECPEGRGCIIAHSYMNSVETDYMQRSEAGGGGTAEYSRSHIAGTRGEHVCRKSLEL